jgi:hypothetical protein
MVSEAAKGGPYICFMGEQVLWRNAPSKGFASLSVVT